MATVVLEQNLSLACPLSSLPSLSISSSHVCFAFFSAYAAGGERFREPLKQKGKERGVGIPLSSLSPSRGFGKKSAPTSKDDKDDDPDPNLCFCGGGDSKLPYTECCMPYHNGTAVVPDGLTLLRARFSAYARGIAGYIVGTTHPKNPDFGDNLLPKAQATCDQLRFYNLDILDHTPISDQESTVTFRVAYGRRKGGPKDQKVMVEKSYFFREGDTWLFRDGEAITES